MLDDFITVTLVTLFSFGIGYWFRGALIDTSRILGGGMSTAEEHRFEYEVAQPIYDAMVNKALYNPGRTPFTDRTEVIEAIEAEVKKVWRDKTKGMDWEEMEPYRRLKEDILAVMKYPMKDWVRLYADVALRQRPRLSALVTQVNVVA